MTWWSLEDVGRAAQNCTSLWWMIAWCIALFCIMFDIIWCLFLSLRFPSNQIKACSLFGTSLVFFVCEYLCYCNCKSFPYKNVFKSHQVTRVATMLLCFFLFSFFCPCNSLLFSAIHPYRFPVSASQSTLSSLVYSPWSKLQNTFEVGHLRYAPRSAVREDQF